MRIFESIRRAVRYGFLTYACTLLFVSPGAAQVVISQVYGGGGNNGATYKNDFVELFNAGSSPVAMNNWSVQYASSTGTSWQATPVSGTLQPGEYFLVQEAAGTGGTVSLPMPEASGSLALSATAGKIALVQASMPLSGACPIDATVADFVGYGSGTNCSRVAATPTLSNTTAAVRGEAGCLNSGNNSSDFSTGAPNPRNSAVALHACSAGSGISITPASLPDGTVDVGYSAALAASGGTGPYSFQASGTLPPGLLLSGAGAISGVPTSTVGSPFAFQVTATDSFGASGAAQFTIAINAQGTCQPTRTIAQVQGAGDTSPLLGQTVVLSGIVTGADRNGFYLQMPTPGDGDPATSDGVYVYTSASRLPAIAVAGNSLCVTGPVGEFAPSSDPNSPTNTEINGATSVTLISSGNPVPPPVTLTASDTDPAGPIDQLERYEGMRVQVDELRVVSPTGGTVNEATATSTSDGVFAGVLPSIARPFREPGIQLPDPLPAGAPPTVVRWDSNPEILAIDSGALPAPLNVTTGAMVSHLVGPLSYSNRAYTLVLEPTSGATAASNGSAAAVPLADASELTISSFNLEHFYNATGVDPGTTHAVLTPTAFANRLNKASLAIRSLLHTPDILALEEVQNLDTLQALANKVNADAGANGEAEPNYAAYLSLGNDISGINTGFLVKRPKVSVVSVTQYGKEATYTNPSGGQSLLNDRPPLVLVADALRPGSDAPLHVVVVANHLRSLLSLDDPATGATVRAKREAQAEYLANLIQNFQAQDPQANVVSVGDYNAYQFSDGYVDTIGVIKGVPAPAEQVVLRGPSLVTPTLTDLIDTDLIAPEERYSYTFGGSAQALDHIIVNATMLKRAVGFAYARNAADFPETFRSDPQRPERVSDHDIPEARFRLPLVVSSKVSVGGTGFLYSRVTRTYSGTLTVTNTSGSVLSGPLSLQLTNLPSGVTPIGGNTLSITGSGLLPGQSATVSVQFADPSNTPITYTAVTYSGAL